MHGPLVPAAEGTQSPLGSRIENFSTAKPPSIDDVITGLTGIRKGLGPNTTWEDRGWQGLNLGLMFAPEMLQGLRGARGAAEAVPAVEAASHAPDWSVFSSPAVSHFPTPPVGALNLDAPTFMREAYQAPRSTPDFANMDLPTFLRRGSNDPMAFTPPLEASAAAPGVIDAHASRIAQRLTENVSPAAEATYQGLLDRRAQRMIPPDYTGIPKRATDNLGPYEQTPFRAAIELPDGQIISGRTHLEAVQKAEAAGYTGGLSDARDGFVRATDPNTLLSRHETEQLMGFPRTTGGIGSEDLLGGTERGFLGLNERGAVPWNTEPGQRLFSRTERALEKAPFEKGTPQQWLAHLERAPGGTFRDEVQQSGLKQILEQAAAPQLDLMHSGPRSFTKDELLKQLRDNPLQIMETRYGSSDAPVPTGVSGPPKFENYKLPGGENYREIILRTPFAPASDFGEMARDLARTNGEDWGQLGPNGRERYMEMARASEPGRYRSSHWPGVDNPIVHVRMTDREVAGKPTTFLEEIQSDIHQAGRENGYSTPEQRAALQRYSELRSKADAADNELRFAENWGQRHEGPGPTPEELQQMRDQAAHATTAADQALEAIGGDASKAGNAVPDLPFKKTEEWSGLAIRRALDEAVQNGHTQLAWTTGEQQANRYSLAKHVDEIHYDPKAHQLIAYKNNSRVAYETDITPEKLPSYIGKEVAQRLLQEPLKTTVAAKGSEGVHVLSGDGLVVGGQGMRNYYDNMLPKMVKEQFRKLGVKVEPKLTEKAVAKAGEFTDTDIRDLARHNDNMVLQDIYDGLPSGPVDPDDFQQLLDDAEERVRDTRADELAQEWEPPRFDADDVRSDAESSVDDTWAGPVDEVIHALPRDAELSTEEFDMLGEGLKHEASDFFDSVKRRLERNYEAPYTKRDIESAYEDVHDEYIASEIESYEEMWNEEHRNDEPPYEEFSDEASQYASRERSRAEDLLDKENLPRGPAQVWTVDIPPELAAKVKDQGLPLGAAKGPAMLGLTGAVAAGGVTAAALMQGKQNPETTQLVPKDEPRFRAWVKRYNIRDLDHPDSHYDYRGAFLAGAKPDAKGHWPDTFKQHGHESFSVQSKYSRGPQDGGRWQGNTYIPQTNAKKDSLMRRIRGY